MYKTMYKIMMYVNGMTINMPFDAGLSFLEACERADIYKRHNSKAVFSVVNDSGEIEYQV